MARARRRGEPTEVGSAGSGGASPPRIPGWLPPVLYGVIVLGLFAPFVFSDEMLFGGDTLSLGYMAREFYAEQMTAGNFPQWNPLILGGIPFIEALASGDSLYPSALLLLVMETHRALGWKLVIHIFLAGLFMFGWVRSLDLSRAAALVAGLAYATAPFLVTLVHPGHDGKIFVISLTPLLFHAMEWTFRRRGLLPYAGVAGGVAVVLFTTHFQLAYFLFGAAGIYYAFRAGQLWVGAGVGVRAAGSAGADGRAEPSGSGAEGGDASGAGSTNRRTDGPRAAVSKFGLFLVASVLGAGIAGVQLVPAFEYVTEWSRRTATTTGAGEAANLAYASSWSLHPEEAFAMVVPQFAGNDAGGGSWTDGTYWGRNVFKDNHEYAGLVVLLLAGLSFFGASRRGLRLFFAGLGGVALLYALGAHTPVWRIFYEVVPGVSLFRAPSMVAFLFGFSAITLAAFGVDRLVELAGGGEGEGAKRGELFLWGAAGVLGLLMILASSGALVELWTSTIYTDPTEVAARKLQALLPHLPAAFLMAAVLAAGTAGVALAARRGWLKPGGVVAVLALLVAVDALRVDHRFVQTLDFERFATPDANHRYLLDRQAEEPPFRVASWLERAQDVDPAMFGLEMATGHHPNDLARYRELIGMEGSSEPTRLGEPAVYQVLNVRYFLLPWELEGRTPVSQARNWQGIPYNVYRTPGFDRARLLTNYEVVEGPAAVDRLVDPDFDPGTSVILAEEPPLQIGRTGAGGGAGEGGGAGVEAGAPDASAPVGSVTWLERGTDRQRVRVSTDRSALLVIADNWYPGWRARVDERETPLLRAYHTLRAVAVPAGEHEVVLEFTSATVRTGLWISVVSLLVVVGFSGFSVAIRRRRGRADVG